MNEGVPPVTKHPTQAAIEPGGVKKRDGELIKPWLKTAKTGEGQKKPEEQKGQPSVETSSGTNRASKVTSQARPASD